MSPTDDDRGTRAACAADEPLARHSRVRCKPGVRRGRRDRDSGGCELWRKDLVSPLAREHCFVSTEAFTADGARGLPAAYEARRLGRARAEKGRENRGKRAEEQRPEAAFQPGPSVGAPLPLHLPNIKHALRARATQSSSRSASERGFRQCTRASCFACAAVGVSALSAVSSGMCCSR